MLFVERFYLLIKYERFCTSASQESILLKFSAEILKRYLLRFIPVHYLFQFYETFGWNCKIRLRKKIYISREKTCVYIGPLDISSRKKSDFCPTRKKRESNFFVGLSLYSDLGERWLTSAYILRARHRGSLGCLEIRLKLKFLRFVEWKSTKNTCVTSMLTF
jgi:hypothetical protein